MDHRDSTFLGEGILFQSNPFHGGGGGGGGGEGGGWVGGGGGGVGYQKQQHDAMVRNLF